MPCRLSMGARLALLATVNLACVAGPRFTKCPGDGGRAWMELDSEHYTLRTDLPPGEATQAMAYLEQTHAAMLASAWPAALRKEMVKVNVYVLADSSEFEGLFPRRLQAFFIRSDNEPTIVLHGRPGSWQRRFTGLSDATSSPLRNELAHHLSTYFLVRQPLWVSEGLAEFLETMQLSEDGRAATLGTPNLHAVSRLKTLLDAATRGALMEPWSLRDVLAFKEKLAAAPEAERPAIARAVVEAHPDDSEAWLLLAVTLRKDPSLVKEREAAYQKAFELSPRSARAANGLAWLYVTPRRYPEALPVAKRAVALAPWSPYILDTYAMAAAGTGACADARLAEQRTIDLLQEHPEPGFEKELRERLAAFGRESCQPPAAEP